MYGEGAIREWTTESIDAWGEVIGISECQVWPTDGVGCRNCLEIDRMVIYDTLFIRYFIFLPGRHFRRSIFSMMI